MIYLRYLALFFIGLANSVPIPIMGATLFIWLTEAGIDKGYFGYFALLSLPFNMKLLWTPIVDQISTPYFALKQRKAWLLFAVYGMALTILGMGLIDPVQHPILLALCIALLSLFTGCIYIVGISYELESLDERCYSIGSAYVITGYRIGLLVGGACLLYLSYFLGWSLAFFSMALLLLVGSLIILFLPEPSKSKEILDDKKQRYLSHSTTLRGLWHEVIWQPSLRFFRNPQWSLILMLMFMFNLGDHMVRVMEGPFYLSLGFNKIDLATAAKMWGMIATLSGSIFAGIYLRGKDPFQYLVRIGLLHAFSLFCYLAMASIGYSFGGLYISVALENFTSGMAMAAFITFLWKICDKSYASVQYPLLWSLYSVKATLFACLGGLLATHLSWTVFFATVAILGIATSLLAGLIMRLRSIGGLWETPYSLRKR